MSFPVFLREMTRLGFVLLDENGMHPDSLHEFVNPTKTGAAVHRMSIRGEDYKHALERFTEITRDPPAQQR